MHSTTRRSLQHFDNQHDFERLAADVLNALGFSGVEPIAPRGGGDGGKDIKFRDGDLLGVAFVTLDKAIRGKFEYDLAKLDVGEGKIALFCNVDVSPKNRLEFARNALEKGFMVDIYDLERLRSLFDSTLTEQRRRYLGIDDSASSQLRTEVQKLLKFPDAFPALNPAQYILEERFVDQLPRRLFDLLMAHDETLIREVPKIGLALADHMTDYYALRLDLARAEVDLITKIGTLGGARFREAWSIVYQYCVMRFGQIPKEDIVKQGDFLNYGITWDSAESAYNTLEQDGGFTGLSLVFEQHGRLSSTVKALLLDM